MLHQKVSGNEKGQIIFFIHGNSQSLNTWDTVIQNKILFEKYKMIAIDLPGHGQSFRSENPSVDYSITGMANTVKKHILETAERDYIIVAASLGTNIASEIIPLDNCEGLFFIGADIIGDGLTLGDVFFPNDKLGAAFSSTPSESAVEALLHDAVFSNDPLILKSLQENFLAVDPSFRPALGECFARLEISDEIKNVNESKCNIALIYGADEKLVSPSYLNGRIKNLWRNEIILVEKAGHFVQYDQPELIASLISEFAVCCFE